MAAPSVDGLNESQDEHDHSRIATLQDQGHVLRSSTSDIVSVRSLRSGSHATVDLVTIPVQGTRKLLVRKMLLQANSESILKPVVSQDNSSSQAVAPALKLSSQQDWTREAAMHRECAQCPFVLQLLAAKRCRSSNLLLLLEYAAQGSLTDMLAARRLELEMQEYSAGGGLQPAAPQAAHTEADTVAAAAVGLHANPASTAEQLQQAAEAHRSSWSGTAAVMQVADDPQVRMVLPLAVTAAHILGEDADSMEDILPVSKMTTTGQLPPQRQEQPFKQHSGIVDEPVLVTLLEDATLSASQCMQEHTHAVLRSSDIVAAATAAAVASDGQLPAALSGLKPVGHGLPEETARFYAACILMALKTLHSRRILHRDIKPCNLLLFHDGYLKLADLGCCCQLPEGISGARTRTGTAGYMAPEVSAGTEPYNHPVDMWSLGVVIWQMVAGSLPAWSAQQDQRQHEGLHWAPDKLGFPRYFSKDLCSLLSGLLQHDSSARLDIRAVQESTWYKDFDWQALQDKSMEAPALGPPYVQT